MAAPIAAAGPDFTAVEPYTTVVLQGSGTDPDIGGFIAGYSWVQTLGSPIVAISGTGAMSTFVAPATLAGTTLTFRLTVTDNTGATATDTMTVTVLPATERAVIGGVEVPARIINVSQ